MRTGTAAITWPPLVAGMDLPTPSRMSISRASWHIAHLGKAGDAMWISSGQECQPRFLACLVIDHDSALELVRSKQVCAKSLDACRTQWWQGLPASSDLQLQNNVSWLECTHPEQHQVRKKSSISEPVMPYLQRRRGRCNDSGTRQPARCLVCSHQ